MPTGSVNELISCLCWIIVSSSRCHSKTAGLTEGDFLLHPGGRCWSLVISTNAERADSRSGENSLGAWVVLALSKAGYESVYVAGQLKPDCRSHWSASWIQRWLSIPTREPSTSTLCLSAALSACIHQFVFLSCQPLFKSICPCVCLSLPPESFVWNIPPKPQLSPALSMFFLAWVNSDKQQVYPRIQSPLARPASCDRSMTKPVRAAHRYSGLDCMWKPVDHLTDELKKRSAIIDQSDWQASISSCFMSGSSDCWAAWM